MRGDQRTRALARIDRELATLAGVSGKAKPVDEYDVVRKEEIEKEDPYNPGKTIKETKTTSTEKRKPPPPEKRGAQKKEGEDEAHREALQAIARGAPKDKVNARLTELGFSPL